MNLYTRMVRPLLFRFDAERIHTLAIRTSEWAGRSSRLRTFMAQCYTFSDARLESQVCGLHFPNPVGLAAGYDKNGRALQAMASLGFGFLEIGSVSADPSDGNPRPRLWRLPRERAIIVNYGLPNEGAEAIAARLASTHLDVPLGINIVKTNRRYVEPAEVIIDDYVRSVRTLKDAGDYLVLNLSCPNTETGRDFFAGPGQPARLLSRLAELGIVCPVFLKVSPLGGVRALEGILEAVECVPFVSGFIFNLPPGKPPELRLGADDIERMPGAVSGKPVEKLVDTAIKELYTRMDRDRYKIIGAGGVFTAEDVYRKIQLGASLVQTLTALVYEGPRVVKAINQGLLPLLKCDGFDNVSDAVGTAAG